MMRSWLLGLWLAPLVVSSGISAAEAESVADVAETAETLGITQETVRTRHFRAKGLLREALAREIDVAESDLFEFGGLHCDGVVASVLAKLSG